MEKLTNKPIDRSYMINKKTTTKKYLISAHTSIFKEKQTNKNKYIIQKDKQQKRQKN